MKSKPSRITMGAEDGADEAAEGRGPAASGTLWTVIVLLLGFSMVDMAG